MGCCGNKTPNVETLRETIREGYGKIARNDDKGCCSPARDADEFARQIGYTEEELASLPEGANMGLSCGNPTAIASLRAGEVVIDLGAGGGFDVFVAARKVGPSGRSIGVDMTPDMITKARQNNVTFSETTGLENCEFRLGEIEYLPLADNFADCIISNCVINLAIDKPQVWREIARVLKPGGRVAVSDMALLKPLPDAIREQTQALIGCVAGASLVEDIRTMAEEAGLIDIEMQPKTEYVASMARLENKPYALIRNELPDNESLSDYVVSLYINAVKPKV